MSDRIPNNYVTYNIIINEPNMKNKILSFNS